MHGAALLKEREMFSNVVLFKLRSVSAQCMIIICPEISFRNLYRLLNYLVWPGKKCKRLTVDGLTHLHGVAEALAVLRLDPDDQNLWPHGFDGQSHTCTGRLDDTF
jgi:hypothetical protein